MIGEKVFDAYEVMFTFDGPEDIPVHPHFPHYMSAELPAVGDIIVLNLTDGPNTFEVVSREFRFDRGGVVWIHVKNSEFPRT